MVGAVSAADENVADDNLEVSDEISVEESVDSSDVESDESLEITDDVDVGEPPEEVFIDAPDGFGVQDMGHNYTALFLHEDESPFAGADVSFFVYGDSYEGDSIEQNYDAVTDDNGYASFIIDLPAGDYCIMITDPYGTEYDGYALTVICPEDYIPRMVLPVPNNLVFYLGNPSVFQVYVEDGFGRQLHGSKVYYSVNNITGSGDTFNGYVTFEIDLPLGQHNVTFSCPDIDMTGSCIAYVLAEPIPSVIADNIVMVKNDGTKLVINCTDKLGNVLSQFGCRLIFDDNYRDQKNVNGVNGTLIYDIDLDVGIHNVTIVNKATNEAITRNITVLAKPSISAEDATLYCEATENKYSISFTNVDGTPLANGKADFIIDDNEEYHFILSTDENGTAYLYLPDLAGGNHVATITNTATGQKTSVIFTFIKAESIISTSAVTTVYNGGKYAVFTLKNSNGAVLKNCAVSVVLNGKTIKGTTDKNGQFKVSTDGLAPKAYTATMTFAGDDYLNTSTATAKITVNKATPKMTAKKATFKTKTKKYTITLKDNKNKAMKKVKVTLKVKGKTYKATTNAKGKATFKLTKLTKKGKYIAKVKFAGNTYYKAVNKSVKLTVKK